MVSPLNSPPITVLTAVGRNEPEYLTQLGVTVAHLADVFGEPVQWCLALDSNQPDAATVHDVTEVLRPFVISCVIDAPESERTGPGSTRNRALARVTAPWMLTIDSDDTINPDGVAELHDAVTASPDLMWAAGRAHDVTVDGRFINAGPDDVYAPGRVPQGQFFPWRASTGNPPFHPSATIARTDAVRRVGGWPERWTRTEDSALWSVLDAWFPGVWVPAHVLNYRKHPTSITADVSYSGSAPELMPAIAGFIHAGSTNPT